MRADPKPEDGVSHIGRVDAEGSIAFTDSHGPEITDLFQMQRRMLWIGLKNRKVLSAAERTWVGKRR